MSRIGSIYRRQPGPVSVSPAYRFIKDSAVSNWGLDSNANTGSWWRRVTGGFMLASYFLLTNVYWDVYNAQTYDLSFVSGLYSNPTILKQLFYGALGSGADRNMAVSPPVIIKPGYHYLSFYTAGNVQQYYYNGASIYVNTFMWFREFSMENNSYNYTIPARLIGYQISPPGNMAAYESASV